MLLGMNGAQTLQHREQLCPTAPQHNSLPLLMEVANPGCLFQNLALDGNDSTQPTSAPRAGLALSSSSAKPTFLLELLGLGIRVGIGVGPLLILFWGVASFVHTEAIFEA